MNIISRFFRSEIQHFDRLTNHAKRLIISYFLYGLGTPLIITFTNAFIWKSSHDFLSVTLYNVGCWVALPIIFFVNGIVLQYISTTFLFTIGLILTASAPFIVIMFSLKGLFMMFLAGIVFGVGWGFYWSNRTFYTLRHTEDTNRNYFYSLSFTLDIVTGIAVPVIIGWIIVLGGNVSYKILAVLLFVTYFAAGLMILPLSMKSSEHSPGVLTKVKGKWNVLRLICVLFGFQSGINLVFPALMILYLLGNEGILGTVSSLGALLSAISIYQIGKVSLSHHRIKIFTFGVIILVASTLFYFLSSHWLGIVVYVVGISIAANFTWSSFSPIFMNLIDQYTPSQKQNRFKYIVDNELFLNIGRILAVGIFFLILYYSSKETSLRYTPVIITCFQILVAYLLKRIVAKHEGKNFFEPKVGIEPTV